MERPTGNHRQPTVGTPLCPATAGWSSSTPLTTSTVSTPGDGAKAAPDRPSRRVPPAEPAVVARSDVPRRLLRSSSCRCGDRRVGAEPGPVGGRTGVPVDLGLLATAVSVGAEARLLRPRYRALGVVVVRHLGLDDGKGPGGRPTLDMSPPCGTAGVKSGGNDQFRRPCRDPRMSRDPTSNRLPTSAAARSPAARDSPLVWFFSVVNNLFRSPPAGEFDAPEVFATVGE